MTKDEVQLEALAATDGKRRCSVVLGTGVGKTLVGLNPVSYTHLTLPTNREV